MSRSVVQRFDTLNSGGLLHVEKREFMRTCHITELETEAKT